VTNTDKITRVKQITIQLANFNYPIVITRKLTVDKSAQVRNHLRGEFMIKYRVPLRSLEEYPHRRAECHQ